MKNSVDFRTYCTPAVTVYVTVADDILTASDLTVADALGFDAIERHEYTIGKP